MSTNGPVTLPEPFSSVLRTSLLLGPSPIHALPRISADLASNSPHTLVTIYAKGDDLNSAYAYGGNKTRKLEYLLAEAQAQGCDALVSIGGVQSNHRRQVAAIAARTGLEARLVQEHWVDWEDQGYETVENIQLSRLMGRCTIRPIEVASGVGRIRSRGVRMENW